MSGEKVSGRGYKYKTIKRGLALFKNVQPPQRRVTALYNVSITSYKVSFGCGDWIDHWVEMKRGKVGVFRFEVHGGRIVVFANANGARTAVVQVRVRDLVFGTNAMTNDDFVDLLKEKRGGRRNVREIQDNNLCRAPPLFFFLKTTNRNKQQYDHYFLKKGPTSTPTQQHPETNTNKHQQPPVLKPPPLFKK